MEVVNFHAGLTTATMFVLSKFLLALQALDTIKKAGSSFPKDETKRLEKEVS